LRILVVDGMGGGIGRAVIERIVDCGYEIEAIGTNAVATSAMRKAGAEATATGENAVIYRAAHADCIIGAMGIVLANAMMGEISPAIAAAISSSEAVKILIPISRCSVYIAGLTEAPMAKYIEGIPAILQKIAAHKGEEHGRSVQ
jgi:hypothetical protein